MHAVIVSLLCAAAAIAADPTAPTGAGEAAWRLVAGIGDRRVAIPATHPDIAPAIVMRADYADFVGGCRPVASLAIDAERVLVHAVGIKLNALWLVTWRDGLVVDFEAITPERAERLGWTIGG